MLRIKICIYITKRDRAACANDEGIRGLGRATNKSFDSGDFIYDHGVMLAYDHKASKVSGAKTGSHGNGAFRTEQVHCT